MIIDLSHKLSNFTPPYPGDPAYEAEQTLSAEKDGFNVHAVRFSTHWGTHIDAARHVNSASMDVAAVPLSALYGHAICIPLNIAGEIPAKTEISCSHLLPFESLIQSRRRVIIQTGWSKNWGKENYFSDAPWFSVHALEFLVEKKIQLLGLDIPSPTSEENLLAGHKRLLENGVVLLENLTNLNLLPAAPLEFILSALPLPIEGLDGFPVRAVGVL